MIHFITSEKRKWNHLWKVQEDYGAGFREIAVCKSPALTNHTFAGIIKVFPNVFVSGIVGEVEHLWAQKFVQGSHFISIRTHVTSVENSTDSLIHVIYDTSYQDV